MCKPVRSGHYKGQGLEGQDPVEKERNRRRLELDPSPRDITVLAEPLYLLLLITGQCLLSTLIRFKEKKKKILGGHYPGHHNPPIQPPLGRTVCPSEEGHDGNKTLGC